MNSGRDEENKAMRPLKRLLYRILLSGSLFFSKIEFFGMLVALKWFKRIFMGFLNTLMNEVD